jgi:ABC-type Fe3+ transport system substrate-binding protein
LRHCEAPAARLGHLVFSARGVDHPVQNALRRRIIVTAVCARRLAAFSVIAAIAVAATLAAAPRSVQAQSLDALYAKAKAEGALAFYAGGPTAPWEARAKAFAALYPGIEVSIGGGFSNALDNKIDQQIAAQKLEVDAAILQTIVDFVRWKAEDRLAIFKPDGFEAMDASFKDADGAFWATMVNVVPYMFNTDKVATAEVPNSALDFLQPQFRGRMVTPYPADDDVTLWVFYHIVQKYGWGYMDKYMAARPNFIQGHLGEQRSIGAGQNWVTFDSIYDLTAELKRQGMPVETHFPAVDATPIWPLTAAIFKDALHPNAARLFFSWLLAPEQQAKLTTWSPRSDVAPPAGRQPILSYHVANDYRAFLTDQPQVAALRQRFESYTGPVVNAGGVR